MRVPDCESHCDPLYRELSGSILLQTALNQVHFKEQATMVYQSTSLSRRQFLRGAAGLVAGAMLTAACSMQTLSRANSTSTPTTFKAEVAVSHFKSLMSLMAWTVGLEKGFFQDAEIVQNFTEYEGGGDTIRGLLAAGSHYAIAAPSAAIAAFVQGEPVRIIGGGFGASTVVFVVKRNGPIQHIEDLKGKKIGYSKPGSNTHVLATTLNQQHDLGAELVSTGGVGESLIALRNDLVDCVWTVEPQPSRYTAEFRRLVSGEEIIPHFVELVLLSRERFIEERPDVLRAVAQAYNKSMHIVREQPAAAASSWAKVAGLDAAVVADAMQHVPSDAWTAKLLPDGLRTIERTMLDFKLITQTVDWNRLVVQDFLPAENRAQF
jgi:NitT/TauT family transport system substrate-binding protein